jgi:hypothetical protein
MNKTFSRISAALLLLGVIASLFYFITMAGKKESGPLEDMLGLIGSKVASWEKNVVRDNEESRSSSLQWFHVIRNSTIRLNHLDTILTGAYDDNTAESYESIVSLEDSLQFNLPVVSIYTAWGSQKIQVFPSLRAQAIYDLGSIPLITWEPWLNDFNEETYPFLKGVTNKNLNGMNAITAGKFDAYVDKWAADAKKFGRPFFLRFGHEMNDPYRYPWGAQNNKPWEFIAAWRHIHERFKKAGATNVLWLWSPHPAYLPYSDFYPGHDFVDWIGTTTLNYGTVAPWSQWWTFDETFQKCYADLSLYGKPLMLTELGSLNVGGDKAKWFYQALDSLPSKYPAVKSVVFFHNTNDNTTTYKSLDWSFASEPKVAAAIRKAMANWPGIYARQRKGSIEKK